MTLQEMNLYLEDRGFEVIREKISKGGEFKFTLTKDGITKSYLWNYGINDQYKKESLDNMVKVFKEDALKEYMLRGCLNRLYGSMSDGYTYASTAPDNYAKYCKADWETTRPPLVPHFDIQKVIFNEPLTIVIWSDGTKTFVKAHDEEFDREKGLAMAIAKKFLGNKYNYHKQFEEWLTKGDKHVKSKKARD
jgi:hypothetical protein